MHIEAPNYEILIFLNQILQSVHFLVLVVLNSSIPTLSNPHTRKETPGQGDITL